MTTTMRERFEDDISDIFYEIPKTGKECSNNKQKVLDFIEKELTKKDQEHKAELEMIKGEIDKVFPINTESNMVEVDMYSYDLAKKDAISILDSHINKIST